MAESGDDGRKIEVGSPEYEEIMDRLMAARLNEVHETDPFVGGAVLDADGWRPITEPLTPPPG